jgi:hypothetical protein
MIDILNEFPNIKLSYETIIHKKVYNADYIVAIPQGIKCFAWFTVVTDKSVCLIMELTNNKQISNIKIVNSCFSEELSYGTILYGTKVNGTLFYIEDIFSYKGNSLSMISWGEKLNLFYKLLKNDLRQVAYNKSFMVFGLPLMYKTNEEIEQALLTYKIENIQYKLFHKVNNYLVLCKSELGKPDLGKSDLGKSDIGKRDNVFIIRPDILDDIYYMYTLNSVLHEEKQGVINIPNYDTSVKMNKLFRIIKENDNLDALEESDEEDEYENINIDKFVHLDKSYKMICQFNHKFKKWTPIKIANDNAIVMTTSELKNMYASYTNNKYTNYTNNTNKYNTNNTNNKYTNNTNKYNTNNTNNTNKYTNNTNKYNTNNTNNTNKYNTNNTNNTNKYNTNNKYTNK